MAIDDKKEQIKQYEELAHLKELGLEKADLMLKQDLERFNEFFEAKKQACRLAIKKAEEQHKRNVQKNKRIKELIE